MNKVNRALAKHLDTLFKMKTTVGYGYRPITPERATKAGTRYECPAGHRLRGVRTLNVKAAATVARPF